MFKKLMLAVVVGAGFLASTGAATAQEQVKSDKQANVNGLWRMYEELRDLKRYDEANGVLDQVLKIDATNTYAWSERAWIFNDTGRYQEAVTAGEKAIAFNVDNSTAWRELGYALMMLKQHEDATKALRTAIEKDWQNWPAYDYLADNYEKLGKFSTAKEIRAEKEKRMAKAKEMTGGN